MSQRSTRAAAPAAAGLTAADVERYRHDGYLVKRGQFDEAELQEIAAHFAELHAAGGIPGCFEVKEGTDPLLRWPRMLAPHRVDEVARRLLVDDRTLGTAARLCGEPLLGANTMWYWKPPGSRGQALHQDDFYLRTRPGGCIAAWVAIDAADRDNGCLMVVPASHDSELQCPHPADPVLSFSRHEVDVAPGAEPAYMELSPGDVVYFDGRTIHGSMPNVTADRRRRSFTCHYVPASSGSCALDYQPLVDEEGSEVWIDESGPDTDPCGGPSYPMS